MLIKGLFALRVYDFLKKVHLYMSIQDYMAIRDLRVYFYLIFAILHFGRRKFEHDPVVTLPIETNSEVSNMFTRVDFIQNRLNMKWLRKLNSLLGLLK